MSKRTFEESEDIKTTHHTKEGEVKKKAKTESPKNVRIQTIISLEGVETRVAPQLGRKLAIRLRDYCINSMKKEREKLKKGKEMEGFSNRLLEIMTGKKKEKVRDFIIKDKMFRVIFQEETVRKEAELKMISNDLNDIEQYLNKKETESGIIASRVIDLIDEKMPDLCMLMGEKFINHILGFTEKDTVESVDKEEDEKMKRLGIAFKEILEDNN